MADSETAADTTTADGLAAELETRLTDGDGERVVVVNPTREVVQLLAEAGAGSPGVDVLAREKRLRPLRRQFSTASRLAERVADGSLRVRAAPLEEPSTVFVGPETAFVVVTVGGESTTVEVSDPALQSAIYDHTRAAFADATAFALRQPPLSAAVDDARAALGEAFATDFRRAVVVADDLVAPSAFHPVRVALVLAAHHELLHYDVRQWGEDAGVGSTATFSRHKTRLEDEGLVGTERVGSEFGRPRQRLVAPAATADLLADGGVEAVVRRTA